AEAARREAEAAHQEAEAARRAADAATKEAEAARQSTADRDAAHTAAEVIAAEREAARATTEAAAAEQATLLQALGQRDRLAAAAGEAAGRLADDPSALADALGLVAPEAGAPRAVPTPKTASGPSAPTAWHAEGAAPLAEPGERLDASGLDARADARGVAHLAALPLPGGLVLLDAPAWPLHEESLFRAAFAPLALALRNREGQDSGDRNRLLSGVSHEIRSTLTSILGYAEMLSDEAGPAARPMAERILGSSTRLLQTLDTVLITARLEAEGEATLKRLDVGAAVEAAAAPFRPRAEARDLAFF